MPTQSRENQFSYSDAIQMIDGEFDRFEINSDLEMQLREADTATFYHDSCNPEE